jgi:phosphoribosylglycinamide formyltransferase 1
VSRVRAVALASGRGSNFAAILDARSKGRLANLDLTRLIVDREDTGAAQLAKQSGLPVTILNYSSYPGRAEFQAALASAVLAEKPDLLLTLGFMRILPGELVRPLAGRIINIHPSLLPAFPGMRSPRAALQYGVRIAGCTAHFVDEGVDSGPIIFQAAVPVLPDDDETRLAERILVEEHRILTDAVELFCQAKLKIEGRIVRILP